MQQRQKWHAPHQAVERIAELECAAEKALVAMQSASDSKENLELLEQVRFYPLNELQDISVETLYLSSSYYHIFSVKVDILCDYLHLLCKGVQEIDAYFKDLSKSTL